MGFLLGLVPSLLGAVTNYFAAVKNAQVAMYQAKTGATEEIAVAAIQAQATQNVNSKWWQPQSLIGYIIVGYLAAAIGWDKVIAKFVGCSGHQDPGVCTSFATDPLTGDLHLVFITVIIGYFGLAGARAVISKL
jgi:hypothetical protein